MNRVGGPDPQTGYLDRREVAQLLGITLKSFDKVRQRSSNPDDPVPFPEPSIVFGGSPGWTRDQVVEWRRERAAVMEARSLMRRSSRGSPKDL